MNAVLHTEALIWLGNCRPQKESNKGKSVCNNHCRGRAAGSTTASGKSHVRKATSLQMEGNCSERWVLLHQPKMWVLQLGGACEELSFVPPSTGGSAHGAEQRFASTARPGLATALVMLSLELKESLWSDSFSRTAQKVPLLTSKPPRARQARLLQQTKQQRGRGRTEACTGPVYTQLHVWKCYKAFEFKARRAQKHPFPSAATSQTSHRLLKSPGQNVIFAEHSSARRQNLSPAHASCSKHHVPATKIKALGQQEEPVWLQTAKQKGQR